MERVWIFDRRLIKISLFSKIEQYLTLAKLSITWYRGYTVWLLLLFTSLVLSLPIIIGTITLPPGIVAYKIACKIFICNTLTDIATRLILL